MIEDNEFTVPYVWVVCIGIFSVLSAFMGALQIGIKVYNRCFRPPADEINNQILVKCQTILQTTQLFIQQYNSDNSQLHDMMLGVNDIQAVVRHLQVNMARSDIERNVTSALRPTLNNSDKTVNTILRPNPFT